MRSLLFSGSSLAGKTTLAAAAAVKSAKRGYKTLVVSGDPGRSLMDMYGCPLSATITSVTDNLVATQLDNRTLLTQLSSQISQQVRSIVAGEDFGLSAPVGITTVPGLNDFLTLAEVQRLTDTKSWDHVVVDVGPSIDLLRICDAFAAAPRLVHRIGRKGRFIFGASRWGGGVQISNDVAKRAQSLRAWLTDPDKNSVNVVFAPERAHINETRKTLSALALHNFPVHHVIVNRLIPAPGVWPGSAAGWMKTRHDEQQVLVSSLSGYGEFLVIEQRPTEPMGITAITEFAANLPERLLPSTAGRIGNEVKSDTHNDTKIVPTLSGYQLHISLPLSSRTNVELSRVHDNLIVTIDGFRRIISLPEQLRPCHATEAESHARGITVSLVHPKGSGISRGVGSG